MQNPFRDRCPSCRSAEVVHPAGWIPNLYAMQPFKCNSCGTEFEASMISRLGLWTFVTALSAGVLFHEFFERTVGKDASQVLALSFLGLFFAAVLLGCGLQLFRPWQYVV